MLLSALYERCSLFCFVRFLLFLLIPLLRFLQLFRSNGKRGDFQSSIVFTGDFLYLHMVTCNWRWKLFNEVTSLSSETINNKNIHDVSSRKTCVFLLIPSLVVKSYFICLYTHIRHKMNTFLFPSLRILISFFNQKVIIHWTILSIHYINASSIDYYNYIKYMEICCLMRNLFGV